MYLMKSFFKFKVFILLAFSIIFYPEIPPTINAHQKAVSGTNKIHGGDFTLQSADGSVSLSDFRGSVVLIFFGYTACASVCPISLATISNTFRKMLPENLERTKALFISLDPDRDNLKVLKQYTDYFHKNIIGLTDNIKHLKKVARQYGMKYEKTLVPESELGYVISHSSDIIVLGIDGKLSGTFPHNTDAQPLLNYIRNILEEN